MVRTALFAAALVAVPAADAQSSADLWPLVPGNTWTFVTSSGSGDPWSGETIVGGAFDWTAVDSVDTPAGRLPGLRIGTGPGPADCAVRLSPGAPESIAVELLDPATGESCAALMFPSDDGAPVLWDEGSTPVVVGGESLGERRLFEAYYSYGAGSFDESFSYYFVHQLGMLEYRRSISGSGGTYTSSGYRLRRAALDSTAYGQPLGSRADFWPLEAGNRWEFRLTDAAGAEAGAVAWTVVIDNAGVALRLDRFAEDMVVSTVTCPVSVAAPTAASGWQTTFTTTCSLPDPALFPSLPIAPDPLRFDIYTELVPVEIGGQLVTLDVAAGGRSTGGALGTTSTARISLGRGVGPVSYHLSNPYGMPSGISWTAALGYARVGETEYGQHVVSADGAPETARLALTVAPNPVAGTAHVRFSLSAPAEALRLVVLDALGRRVGDRDLGARAAGAGEVSLDVSRLAPGVYTVRLLGAGAVATARLSVVR